MSTDDWRTTGIHRGTEPPEDSDFKPQDWVEIPHEHHLPIPKARIVNAVRQHNQAEEGDPHFRDLVRLVEGLLHFHYHETLNLLKEDYEYFSPESGAMARKGVDDAELQRRERRFLINFVKTMLRGNFLPFTQEHYANALEQDFLLDLPVEIDWRSHDERMLAELYAAVDSNTEEGREARALLQLEQPLRQLLSPPHEVGDNAWVFFRGLEPEQLSGRFLAQKLDLFLTRLTYPVVFPLQWLIDRVRGNTSPPEASDPEPLRLADGGQSVFEQRWLLRRNLKNQPLLRNLFKTVELQEPAMRQVITVFRTRPSGEGLAQKLRRKPKEGVPPRDWTIQVKMFRHIPMADAEIIFPEKIIRMKSFDMAVLLIMGAAAIPTLINAFTSGGGASFAVAGVLAVYVSRLVGRYLRTRKEYLARMTRDLYDKNIDNNIGVLQYLVDSLEEQEFKEAILVYALLHFSGQPLTPEELDGHIESFIHDHFALEVDFEVEDALAKVLPPEHSTASITMGIVFPVEGEDGITRYQARPIEEALAVLDHAWDNIFQYS